jgi:hypothetical protein
MHISPGGHGGILNGSIGTLFLLLVSESNSGITVTLDSVVDVLVVLYFIPRICRCANVSCCER